MFSIPVVIQLHVSTINVLLKHLLRQLFNFSVSKSSKNNSLRNNNIVNSFLQKKMFLFVYHFIGYFNCLKAQV